MSSIYFLFVTKLINYIWVEHLKSVIYLNNLAWSNIMGSAIADGFVMLVEIESRSETEPFFNYEKIDILKRGF